MRILISGASGLIGRAVVEHFSAGGHEVTRLVRGGPTANRPAIWWDPTAQQLDPLPFERFDAVVHLAGENIAEGRWTAEKKARIRESRVAGTRLVAQTLAQTTHKPRVFISASASGFYGNRGEEWVDESSPPGTGFLAETCVEWEEATQAAQKAGIHTVLLRIGIVLTPNGGILAKVVPLFRVGLGGRIGSGRQFLSWISLDDLVQVIDFLILKETVAGPVNAVSPSPVRNREFTAALARVLRRFAIFPAPAWALRLVMGEMADELLLASTRVAPRRLQEAGFEFRDPQLEPTLRRLLRP